MEKENKEMLIRETNANFSFMVRIPNIYMKLEILNNISKELYNSMSLSKMGLLDVVNAISIARKQMKDAALRSLLKFLVILNCSFKDIEKPKVN